MIIKFAIFAAVSTKTQAAADKISLPAQVERCRQAGQGHGWSESAGPFVAPGQSRTRHINLRDAEAAIPALHDLLEAAQRRQFDLLITYDLNRFRELLDQVYRTLKDYRVQLYSLSQPVEPVPPDHFDPYANDTMDMIVGMNIITSGSETSQIRRRYRTGMPARIRRGLPHIVPFGYRKPPGHETDRNAIPEQDPALVPAVLRMKELLLAGRSIRQIVAALEADHISPPARLTWHPQTIRDILRNPFYAGHVRWGASRLVRDRRTDYVYKDRHVPPDQVILAEGKHQPLWDDQTWHALLAELKRRGKSYRGRRNNQFTGLVKCGQCGASLWRQGNGPRSVPDRLIWRCSSGLPAHPVITQPDLQAAVAAQLQVSLRPYLRLQQDPAPAPQLLDVATRRLDDLTRQLTRLEDAYLSGQWDLVRYSLRKAGFDERLAEARQQLDDASAEALRRSRQAGALLITLDGLHDHLPAWLASDDPAEINHLLHFLLRAIHVAEDGSITLEFLP